MNKIHFSSITDNWETPENFYKELDKEFSFDYDPCPINAQIDGLNTAWGKVSFVNPPYSQLAKWLKKGYEEYQKGKTVVFLIPARTDTIAWHDYCMKAKEIRFIKGRLKFSGQKNSAPFPSCVVVFQSE